MGPDAMILVFFIFSGQHFHSALSSLSVQAMIDFIFLGSKITADDGCSHEIKRCLLFRRKAMTNLESILKSRDITLPTKIHTVKDVVFPRMYELDHKAEH